MKKLSCIILMILFLNSLSFNAVYAEEQIKLTEDMSSAIEVLRLLEIIPDYYEYNADISKNVTRADFAAALAHIITAKDIQGDYTYYYDVPQSHWAYDEICILTEMKILSGDGNKLFYPNEPMTKPEACKMALGMLGYGKHAELAGGYPNGYMTTAKKAGLLDGVASDEYVTLGDMFMLLFNTIKTEVYEPIVYSEDNIRYNVAEGVTLLTIYRDIYYSKGIVTGADCITADGNYIAESEVIISDVKYNTDLDLANYLGESVEFFYRFKENIDYREIIWAKNTDSRNVKYVVADNDASFDTYSYELEYYDGDSAVSRKIILEKGITVIYNGGVVDKKISDVFNMPRFRAKFVKDSNGKYNFAVVEAYENIVVDKVDAINKVIYDKLNPEEKLSLDANQYDRLKIEMTGNDTMSFDNIKTGYVLSYYLSADERYLSVKVCNEQIDGKIDSIKNSKYGITVYVNGNSYYMNGNDTPISFGVKDNVTVYLDINGEIAYIKVKEKDSFPVYVISCAEARGFGKPKYKVLTANGEIKILDCADKVRFDGEMISQNEKISGYFLENGQFVSQIAMLELSAEGEIKAVDTVKENIKDTSESLSVSVPYSENLEYRHNGLIGAMSVINENTVIFAVPTGAKKNTEDKDYRVVSKAMLKDKEWLNAETYKTSKKIGYEQYVVLKGYDVENYSTDAVPVLVASVSTAVNKEGTVVECINGYQGNSEVSYLASEDCNFSFVEQGIGEGSLVWLQLNSDNEIKDLKHLFSVVDDSVYTFDSNIDSEYRTTYGYVHDVIDGVLKLGYNDPSVIDQVMTTVGVPVLVFDSHNSRKPISVGTIYDATTWENEGANCSKIVMITKWRVPKVFVIYK